MSTLSVPQHFPSSRKLKSLSEGKKHCLCKEDSFCAGPSVERWLIDLKKVKNSLRKLFGKPCFNFTVKQETKMTPRSANLYLMFYKTIFKSLYPWIVVQWVVAIIIIFKLSLKSFSQMGLIRFYFQQQNQSMKFFVSFWNAPVPPKYHFNRSTALVPPKYK